jgi:hypothetical protein
MKTKYIPFFTRDKAIALAWQISKNDFSGLKALSSYFPDRKGSWGYYASIILEWIESGFRLPLPFKVFKKGNAKLPFSAFSTLPIVNCPGAGDCLKFCYSLNAWSYPTVFFRQVQNTLLLSNEIGRGIIINEFNNLPSGVLRLYVDGDFKTVSDVVFWMELIASCPDIKAYGYSKSWIELISCGLKKGFQWPSNYLLNLSNGSKHGEDIKAIVSTLPIVRGEFIAIPVDKKHIHNRAYQGPEKAGFREYQKEVIFNASKLGKKVFVCKGKCGACLPNGEHACGSNKFWGVSVAIGVH